MSGELLRPGTDPHTVAVNLRIALGDLVRATRSADTLAPNPAAVLDLLDRRGPMTTADLAAARQVRHQTMAATVKELIEADLLTTAPDPGDGRKKVLRLSPSGSDALKTDRQARIRYLTEALKRALNSDELQALAGSLRLIEKVTQAIVDGMDATVPDPGPVTGGW